jgi:hypothetical protein
MLISTKSEEKTTTHDGSAKKRETKAQVKTTLFKMKLKKQPFKHQDVLASPILQQITGNRHKRASPSPTKSEERNIIQTKFVRSRSIVSRADYFDNNDSDDDKVEMIVT